MPPIHNTLEICDRNNTMGRVSHTKYKCQTTRPTEQSGIAQYLSEVPLIHNTLKVCDRNKLCNGIVPHIMQ